MEQCIKKSIKGKMGTWHDYLRYAHRFGKGARPSPGFEPHHHSNVRLISFLKTLRKEEIKGHVRTLIDAEESMLNVVQHLPPGRSIISVLAFKF